MPRPRLIFVSPVIPAESGNGLAMRSAAMLTALSDLYDITLLVVPIYSGGPATALSASLESACVEVQIAESPTSQPDAANPDTIRQTVDAVFRECEFDVIHMFRLAMLPFVESHVVVGAGRRPLVQLDLDDIESITHIRLARLAERNGNHELAREYRNLASDYLDMENRALELVDRVFVCSEQDRVLLKGRAGSGCRISVIPNVVTSPPEPLPLPDPTEPFRFLFVGTLGYYPNEDAVIWFATEILPLLRAKADRAFEVEIVGTGASDRLSEIAASSGIRLIGEVPEVQPHYERASATIVPIRAGGGTRIKVLESFALGRPVVATPAGDEGINAIDGQHLLLAHDPDTFAVQCGRLMAEPKLGIDLIQNARKLVSDDYAPATTAAAIANVAGPPAR